MKKVLPLLFILLTAFNAKAQESENVDNKWRFGLKGTPGVSWLKSNKRGMENDKAGFAIGGGLQIERHLTKTVSFVTGVDLSVHSGTIAFNDTNIYLQYANPADSKTTYYKMISRKYTFQNIDIPLAIKLKTNEIGYLTYWAQVGLMPSILWRAKATENTYHGSVKSVFNENDGKIDVRDDSYLFRSSLIFALGVEYNLTGSTSLLLGLNYTSGFTSTLSRKSESLYYSKDISKPLQQDISSNYIALTVGILF